MVPYTYGSSHLAYHRLSLASSKQKPARKHREQVAHASFPMQRPMRRMLISFSARSAFPTRKRICLSRNHPDDASRDTLKPTSGRTRFLLDRFCQSKLSAAITLCSYPLLSLFSCSLRPHGLSRKPSISGSPSVRHTASPTRHPAASCCEATATSRLQPQAKLQRFSPRSNPPTAASAHAKHCNTCDRIPIRQWNRLSQFRWECPFGWVVSISKTLSLTRFLKYTAAPMHTVIRDSSHANPISSSAPKTAREQFVRLLSTMTVSPFTPSAKAYAKTPCGATNCQGT